MRIKWPKYHIFGAVRGWYMVEKRRPPKRHIWTRYETYIQNFSPLLNLKKNYLCEEQAKKMKKILKEYKLWYFKCNWYNSFSVFLSNACYSKNCLPRSSFLTFLGNISTKYHKINKGCGQLIFLNISTWNYKINPIQGQLIFLFIST